MNHEEAESFAIKCVIGIAICIVIMLTIVITWDGTGEAPGDNPLCWLAAVMILILMMAGSMAGEFANNSHSTTTKKYRQKKKRKCGLCRKEGHTRRTCPDKKKQEKEVKQPTAKEEYWSFTCVGVEEEKCGEKIFIEKWVRDVIVNYQKARDSDKRLDDGDEAVREAAYDDLGDLELKNEKGAGLDIQCPKCSMTIPYQWDLDPGGKPKDWVRDTPPYRLMRIEMYSHYELGKWKRKKTRAERKAEAEKKVLADFSKSMDRVLGKKSSKSLDDLVEDFIAKDMGNVGIPGQVVKECLDCKRIRAENDWSPCPCGGMSFRRKTM